MTAAAHEFFSDYTRALLARDPDAVAAFYAVPALICFPGRPLAVGAPTQTRDYFAAHLPGYEGVTSIRPEVEVAAATEASIWADVTWHLEGRPPERYMYQLILDGESWRIAVLTPLSL